MIAANFLDLMVEREKTPFKRPLDITEGLDTSISFYCNLQYDNLSKDMIHHALSLLRQHHPCFRLHAENINGEIWLVEEETGELPVTWVKGVTANWEAELIDCANQSRDHTVSLTFLRCRYDTQGRYQLFGVINHIALDGLGFIKALHTFCNYLGELSTCSNYRTVPLRDRRPFIDVFARNPIAQRQEFNFNYNHLPPQGIDSDENNVQSCLSPLKGRMIGLFKKFDRATTTKLLAYSKTHSTTIQGMLSTAALITSIWIRKVRPQLPIWTLNWCATNLRLSAQPPIDSGDCVCASAPLAWEQKVEEDMSIWCLAHHASKELHKQNSLHMGWQFLNAKKYGVFVKPPTLMTSSSGKAQIGTSYGKIQVKDLRIMSAHYDNISIDASSHMNYVWIYDGQLNLATTFTHPGLSEQWGNRFHNGIIYIFDCFANDSKLTVNAVLDALDKKDKCLQFHPVSSSSIVRSKIVSNVNRVVINSYQICARHLRTVTGLTVLSCCAMLLSVCCMSYLQRNLAIFKKAFIRSIFVH